MRGDKAGMIREHEALVFQHDGGVFAREVHAGAVQAARRADDAWLRRAVQAFAGVDAQVKQGLLRERDALLLAVYRTF